MMLDDWCFVPVSQESQGFPFSRESNAGDNKALHHAMQRNATQRIASHRIASQVLGFQPPVAAALYAASRQAGKNHSTEQQSRVINRIRIGIIQAMPSLAQRPSFNDCPHE